MSVKLISIPPDAEYLICYCARVSNPNNQKSRDIKGLIKYCLKNGHWSIFEMSHIIIEIKTTRAIAAQILRHQMKFQEFSQRYANITDEYTSIPIPELRTQDKKNRQSSHSGMLSTEITNELNTKIENHFNEAIKLYNELIEYGVAKECARAIMPLNTPTIMYASNNIRGWIHYIQTRTHPSTQKEHRVIAEEIKKIFKEVLPIITEALEW